MTGPGLARARNAEHIQNWATPQPFFNTCDAEFSFTLDVCAEPGNAKCKRFYTDAQDGLTMPWGPNEVCWCNPPYGNIGPWLERGLNVVFEQGSTIVYLLPNNTDTSWFHDFCCYGEIRFIRGRLRFERDGDCGGNGPAFGQMLVVFSREISKSGGTVKFIDARGHDLKRAKPIQIPIF